MVLFCGYVKNRFTHINGDNLMEKDEKTVRRQEKTGRRQEKRVPVGLSEEEHALLVRASERSGLSVSSWMRAVCLREAREEGGV
jgi:hypothetical protein